MKDGDLLEVVDVFGCEVLCRASREGRATTWHELLFCYQFKTHDENAPKVGQRFVVTRFDDDGEAVLVPTSIADGAA